MLIKRRPHRAELFKQIGSLITHVLVSIQSYPEYVSNVWITRACLQPLENERRLEEWKQRMKTTDRFDAPGAWMP